MHENDRSKRIGLAEEQLEISKREVERGRVVVRTRVEERDEVAEIELQQQDVTIERVPRGVPIETAPAEPLVIHRLIESGEEGFLRKTIAELREKAFFIRPVETLREKIHRAKEKPSEEDKPNGSATT